MLMADKKIVFNGDSQESINFFGRCGDLYAVPALTNPVEHYLNLLTKDYKIKGTAGEKILFTERKETMLEEYNRAGMYEINSDMTMDEPVPKVAFKGKFFTSLC